MGELVPPLNAAFERQWLAEGKRPARRAGDLLIARRLSLALVGAIPSYEEIGYFENRSPAERLDWWASYLLQDRRSADYLANRLADRYAGTDDRSCLFDRRQRLVDRAADALAANQPFDQVMRELAFTSHGTTFSREAVNRIWELMTGRPLVEPLGEASPRNAAMPVVASPSDLLASTFERRGFDLRFLIRLIAQLDLFRLESTPLESEMSPGKPVPPRDGATFPRTPLRADQALASVLQAAALETIHRDGNVLLRFVRGGRQREFLRQWGETQAAQPNPPGLTPAQRALLAEGHLVRNSLETWHLTNTTCAVTNLPPTDEQAIEVAYLAVLTRPPRPDELARARKQLVGITIERRNQVFVELCLALINSPEFAFNH